MRATEALHLSNPSSKIDAEAKMLCTHLKSAEEELNRLMVGVNKLKDVIAANRGAQLRALLYEAEYRRELDLRRM